MKGSISQYKAIFFALREVWVSYGGWSALLGSPLLHLSIIFSLLSFGAWKSGNWWELGLSVIPAILGFAIGTFAIFVALGDEKFREMIARGGKSRVKSVRDIYVSFVFLIVLQTVSVLLCMFASSRPLASLFDFLRLQTNDFNEITLKSLKVLSTFFRFIGFTLVSYSVLSVIPMTLSVLRMGSIYLGFFLIEGAGQKNSRSEAEILPEGTDAANKVEKS